MDREKIILDACCGSRMMWFDKNNPLALFADLRNESHVLCDGRDLHVRPDIVADFRNMPFADESFRLVVFDPPHIDNLGTGSFMAKKYGQLLPTWDTDINAGINECMRVLKPYGILIFKWNEHRVKLTDVLATLDHQPLFGHTSGKHGRTIWMTFIKTPHQ